MRFLSFVAALMMAGPVLAAPQFAITEIYPGATGEDGTEDWIEVTNIGDMDGDTAGLIYDDESQDAGAGGALPSFILSPGESAVFLVSAGTEATDIAAFEALWGPIENLGWTDGGGGLSQNGDGAALLLSDGTVVDFVPFPGLPSSNIATIEVYPLGLSAVGVRGAYASELFFNDNLPDAIANGNMISLVGSPGRFVPEPTAALLALAGLAAVGGTRRRD